MHRFRRIGRVVALVVLGFAALMTQASARDATRDFPNFRTCPANEPLQPKLVFVATAATAKLTFTACNESNDVTIVLDHVMVVEKTVFNANFLSYPDDPALVNYGIGLLDGDPPHPACYIGDAPYLTSVFDRSSATPNTKRWPFYDKFDGPDQAWELSVNSTRLPWDSPGEQDVTPSRALILTQQGNHNCETARITVGNLIKTRSYVVDFTWFVGGDFGQAVPVMSVTLE